MPRLGGLEVLESLKGNDRFAHIPVFVLTTTDNAVELERCYASGAAACLVKPVDYGAFSDMVRRLADFLAATQLPSEIQGPRPDVH
jgi:CheY-like chemotaxis protein